MEADLTIRVLTNQDPDFYPLLGPFLSRREIVAEIGGPIWDDDSKTWWAAVVNAGHVVGFCAALPAERHTVYQSAYVLPEFRRRGIYQGLWQARRNAFPGPARSMCTSASLPIFLSAGWGVAGTRGSFTKVATA